MFIKMSMPLTVYNSRCDAFLTFYIFLELVLIKYWVRSIYGPLVKSGNGVTKDWVI